jgi:predicted double-glycine peptidase
MRRARSALLLLLFALGCLPLVGFGGPHIEPAVPLLEAVPDVVQTTNYSCGPCALVAVLRYYGIPAEEREVLREARTNPEIGAELEDLAAVAERHGLTAAACEGLGLEDLERELKAGYPVIVLNQSWRANPYVPWDQDWDDGHYLVVIGVDDHFVYVEDPLLEGARGAIPRDEFVRRWHDWSLDKRRAVGQALLVHGRPPPSRPRTVRRFERVR